MTLKREKQEDQELKIRSQKELAEVFLQKKRESLQSTSLDKNSTTVGEEESYNDKAKTSKTSVCGINTIMNVNGKESGSLYVTKHEFFTLNEEVRRLKKRVQQLEKEKVSFPMVQGVVTPSPPIHKKSPSPPPPPAERTLATYNGHTIESLRDSVSHTDIPYKCVHDLLMQLFSTEYLITHSVSGQRSNRDRAPKPKFDERLYGVFITIMNSKFPALTKSDITAKVQAVQKKYSKR